MTKAYIIEFAKSCNFEMDKEVKDLSGNTFFSLRHITTETDLIAIYRDQKDGNFYLLGLYKSDKANQLMERFKNSKWNSHFKAEKEENNMFKDIYSKYKTKIDAALEDYINELQDEYRELSNEDCIEITNTYADEIMSINAVYSNFENAAEETARSLGFVNDMNEAYFDFELFENSLRDNENYIELPSGVVVYITRWKHILTGGNKNEMGQQT